LKQTCTISSLWERHDQWNKFFNQPRIISLSTSNDIDAIAGTIGAMIRQPDHTFLLEKQQCNAEDNNLKAGALAKVDSKHLPTALLDERDSVKRPLSSFSWSERKEQDMLQHVQVQGQTMTPVSSVDILYALQKYIKVLFALSKCHQSSICHVKMSSKYYLPSTNVIKVLFALYKCQQSSLWHLST
jgi:hypothetical protein